MPVFYLGTERFDPGSGDRWKDFINRSGLTHLREVISLDYLLCPNLFPELTEADWEHNVHEDFQTSFFLDLDYLVRKMAGRSGNLLALVREPSAADLRSFADSRFVFRGFDLVESEGSITALVNCGGFEKAFSKTDLSDCGLLPDLEKAVSVQRLLREQYPDELHADCNLWAIWQMKPLNLERPTVP